MAPSPIDLIRGLPDAVFALDADLRYTFVNDRAADLIGAGPDSLVGTPFVDAPVPGADETAFERYRAALTRGEADTVELLHEPSGRCLQHRIFPVEGHLLVILADVTKRRREEDALRRKAMVFDAAGDILVMTDERGVIQGWNPAAEQALGHSRREVRGRAISDFIATPDRETKRSEVLGAVAGEGEWKGDLWVVRKDGSRRLLQTRVRAVRDEAGRLIGTVGVSRDVTDRQDAAEELAALLRAMNDLVLVIDREGRYRRVAGLRPDLLYRPSDELVGRTFGDLFPPAQAAEFEAAVRTALSTGRSVELDYAMHIGDRRHWFHAALSRLDAEHVVWVARDVTDRREALERLRVSEERFRQIAENVRDVFWIADRELTQFLYVSPVYREVWGQGGRELRDPAVFLRRVRADFRDQVAHALGRARAGEATTVVYPFRQGDGASLWLSSRVFPVRDEHGEVYRLAGVTSDITAQREAEEARRLAHERLETFLDTIPDQAWMKDRGGRYVVVNEAYAAARGLSRSEILGRTDRDIFPAELAARFEREDAAILASGTRSRVEDDLRSVDGTARWFEMLKAPVWSEAGEVVGTVGVSRDITDRKRAEERVRQQALLFQTTGDAVIYTGADGRISAWNPGAEQIFGYTAEEARGRETQELLLGEADADGDLGRIIGDALASEGGWQGELELRRRDGSTAVCEAVALPLRDHGGHLTGGISVIRDVTHRRALEEQLRQSQKLEAVGRLAGGIAHDFNNMLLVIQGFASLLEAEVDLNEQAGEYLHEIRHAAERSARLTRQLLAYSRKQILQPDLLDLNHTVTDLQGMLRRTLGEDIALETDLAPDIGAVRADHSQMEQTLLNLAINARDAMPTGGRLTIRTRNHAIRPDDGYADPEVPAGEYVELIVRDTGHGMEPDVLEHVFEPFFTTKAVGEGTGLGLATVYGIVRQSGGFVWAESETGRGTAFHVLLPRLAAGRKAPALAGVEVAASTARTAPAEGSAEVCILLVEDEPAVRDLLQRVLERQGFRVLAAATGDEALDLAGPEAGAADAAIIDVVLPGMSGRAVADRLLERRPDLPILFLSGYTDDHVLRHGISRAERHFLQKPVAPDALIARVRKLLEPS